MCAKGNQLDGHRASKTYFILVSKAETFRASAFFVSKISCFRTKPGCNCPIERLLFRASSRIPDNSNSKGLEMPKQKLEIEIEVPDGYRCVGFGHALPGASYMAPDGFVCVWDGVNPTAGQYVIISPIERWRPATVDDVIRSLQGQDVDARFRGPATNQWVGGKICGFREYDKYGRWLCQHKSWEHCEVLDTQDSSQ